MSSQWHSGSFRSGSSSSSGSSGERSDGGLVGPVCRVDLSVDLREVEIRSQFGPSSILPSSARPLRSIVRLSEDGMVVDPEEGTLFSSSVGRAPAPVPARRDRIESDPPSVVRLVVELETSGDPEKTIEEVRKALNLRLGSVFRGVGAVWIGSRSSAS